MKSKRVILIEDHQLIRESYIKIIDAVEGYSVIQGYESCEEALEEVLQTKPDIVFIDITLPGMNGIEGTKRFKQLLPQAQIIVITVHEQSSYVFEALCAGAIGYLTKAGGMQQVSEALSQLQLGGAPMSCNIARKVVESFQMKKIKSLSTRENEVLDELAKGKSYASIADVMFVSVNTIKTHIRNIYEKLQVSNRDEAAELYKSYQ